MNLLRCFVFSALAFLMIALPSSTCEWDYPIWIPRSATADPLYRFTKDHKAGYIDQTGKVAVPPVISFLGGNGGGGFLDWLVGKGGFGGGFVGTSGKKKIGKGVFRGWGFFEGVGGARKKGGGTCG